MKMRLPMSIVVGVLSLLTAGEEHFFAEPSHRDLLQKGFVVSEARQSWSSEQWWVYCLFADLDCDGTDEVVTMTTSQCDRSGSSWSFWKVESDMLRSVSVRGKGRFVFNCHPQSYYKILLKDGLQCIALLGITAGGIDDKRMMIPDTKFSDASVGLAPDGVVDIKRLPSAFDDVFAGEAVCGIERLYGESYKGFDFVPVRREYWFHARRPKGDLRPSGGIAKPDGFEAFAAKLRREVASRMGADGREIRALAVFLDADNDGDADAYIAFATDRTRGGKFRWTLWLNNGGGHSRATGPVYPVPSKSGLCELPPSVVAATNGFCRVLRFDAEPTFLVLDGKGSPTKVRDAITDVFTHRVEKLPCVEFREK